MKRVRRTYRTKERFKKYQRKAGREIKKGKRNILKRFERRSYPEKARRIVSRRYEKRHNMQREYKEDRKCKGNILLSS
jgi:hypothetical protein